MAPPIPNWSHVRWPDIHLDREYLRYTLPWIRRLQIMYKNYWVTEVTQNVFVVEDFVLKPDPHATITPPPTPSWTRTMPMEANWDIVPVIHPGRSSMWGAFGVDLSFYFVFLCYFLFLLAIGGCACYFLRGRGGGDGSGSGPGFGGNGGKGGLGGPGGKDGPGGKGRKKKEPLFPFYSNPTITKKALRAKVNGTSSSNHGNGVDGNCPPPASGYGNALLHRPWSVFVNNARVLVGTSVSHEFSVDDDWILNVVTNIPGPQSTPQKGALSDPKVPSSGDGDNAPSTGNGPPSGEDDDLDSWIDDTASLSDLDSQQGDLLDSSGHHSSASSMDDLSWVACIPNAGYPGLMARLRRLEVRINRANNPSATLLLCNVIWLFVWTMVSFLSLVVLLSISGFEFTNDRCWTRSSYLRGIPWYHPNAQCLSNSDLTERIVSGTIASVGSYSFLTARRHRCSPHMAAGFFLCFVSFGLIALLGREGITDWCRMMHGYAEESSWSLFEALSLVPFWIWNRLLVLYAWLLLLWEYYRHTDSLYKSLAICIVLSVGAIVCFSLGQQDSPRLNVMFGKIQWEHPGWIALVSSKIKDLAFVWSKVITFIRQSCWPRIKALTGVACNLVGHLLGWFCKGVWGVAVFVFEQQKAYNRRNDQYIAQLERELSDTKEELTVKTKHEKARYREVIQANNNWEADIEKLEQVEKERDCYKKDLAKQVKLYETLRQNRPEMTLLDPRTFSNPAAFTTAVRELLAKHAAELDESEQKHKNRVSQLEGKHKKDLWFHKNLLLKTSEEAQKRLAELERKNAFLSHQVQEAGSFQPQAKTTAPTADLQKENRFLRLTVESLKSRNAALNTNNKVLDKSRAENEVLKAQLKAMERKLKEAGSKLKPQQTPVTSGIKEPTAGRNGDEQTDNGVSWQTNNTSGANPAQAPGGAEQQGQVEDQGSAAADKKQQPGTNDPEPEEADKGSSVGTVKKEEPTDEQSQSQSSSGDQEPSKDPQPSGGDKPSHDEEFSADKAQPKPSVSHSDRFNNSFPDGYSIVPTRADGLLCGYYAIIESLKAMDFKPLSEIDELKKSFKDPEVQKALEEGLETGEILNTDFFGGDQLAIILRHWGEQRGRQLQLGFITNDDLQLLQFHERQDDPDTIIVWIHNSAGVHWSGLRQGNIKPKAAK
ncbi:MAG: hypothetical protein Q9201_000582 [Fulgogasparrea decipioides]